jgi:hypothetical protein
MDPSAHTKAFDNVKSQVGACGIWCGSCVVGNGVFVELTKRYHRVLRDYGVLTWAAEGFDAAEFTKGLETVVHLPLCPGCRKGGGRRDCELRRCAEETAGGSCCGCGRASGCQHRDLLAHMRDGALKAGLVVTSKPATTAEEIEKWTTGIRHRFPSSLLFTEDHREAGQ